MCYGTCSKVDIHSRVVSWCHNFKKMMRIMAYVKRIIGTFGGIIGRNAKNCRIE